MEQIYKEQIKKLWDNGESIDRIIKLLPFEKKIVAKAIIEMRKNGELLMEDRNKNKTKKNKILRLYNSGVQNPYTIAEEVGCSLLSVKAVLYRAGIKRKRPSKNYKERKKSDVSTLKETTQKIISEIKTGKPKSQIAKMYGVSRQWVYAIEKTQIKGIKRKIKIKGEL